ncbi:AraC family ligand binding domain-containing protein [Photobacterium damselae subsp. piscicida]|uniref:AraC family ligand binding domain-containing protein n=1 Tax=Photobacterium damselae TaxID=38293 RepID=UPI001FD7443C|nr:hypothetical protein [Photobacterium damselae]
MESPPDSGLHKHDKDQLLYAPFGCMNITLDRQKLLLPPTKAAWIPANTIHCAKMTNVVEYRSIYFDTALTENLKLSLKTVEVPPHYFKHLLNEWRFGHGRSLLLR